MLPFVKKTISHDVEEVEYNRLYKDARKSVVQIYQIYGMPND